MPFTIDTVIQHMELLVLGQVPGAVHPVPNGRFSKVNDRDAVASYKDGAASRRPFYISLDDTDDHLPGEDEQNVSGNLIDSSHTVTLTVAYLAGGGSMGRADQHALRAEQAKDGRYFRDCLTYVANYDSLDDSDGNGVMNVRAGTARTLTPPRPSRRRPGPSISLRAYPFSVWIRENWTQEP